ncbi:hypothetical protein KKC32_00780 [Patescibacteria group bacterium]|nr:hypothetical protein [Patescibacteria group bacterium]
MIKFFGKIISLASLSLFVFFGFAGGASAQTELLFGQNHYYTVIFRGNGEAITYAKIAITNSDEKPLTEFLFEIPKVSPEEMVIYQMKLPQECVNYDYTDPARPCLEYRDPDYAQQYYYAGNGNGKTEYQKIQYTKSGNLYRLILPTPVESYKSTAIIIAYAAKGYVSESLGLYKFNFETIKVPSRIQQIRVAVDVDSDLLLKGKRASVNYNATGLQSSELSASVGISDRNLDNVVGMIGSYAPFVKDAKNLAPNESYLVKGQYSTSWFRLYLSSILLVIFGIAAIFVGVYFLSKFLKRRGGKNEQPTIGTGQQIVSRNQQSSISILNLTNASVSFLSAILVVGLTYLFSFVSESNLFRAFNPDLIFGIVAIITIILLYALVIFGPAIIVAIKHGWKSLISILIAEFLWFVMFLAIYFALFQSGF